MNNINLSEIKILTKYACPYCEKDYSILSAAEYCRNDCYKAQEGNKLLESGATLKEINDKFNIWIELPEYLHNVTKDNCFVISHWQCCDYPAYKIISIKSGGKLFLWGKGSWSSGYGCDLNTSDYNLKNPRPKEELYIYESITRL